MEVEENAEEGGIGEWNERLIMSRLGLRLYL